jgi:hypothetical protein
MSTELDRIELGRFASFRGFFDRPDQSEQSPTWYLQPRLLWLPALLIVGLGAGVLWFDSDGGSAEGEPLGPEIEAPASPATVATVSPQPASSQPAWYPDKPAATVDAAPQASDVPPVDGLSISSQSWRRGGLGSKALVTFTLRNNNDYAVKDIEVACAFVRRDGSHLTDRSRVITDTVNMKSRKTFARVLVGFVNVNASRAKCAPVAANRS